jgi:hypothetical protein
MELIFILVFILSLLFLEILGTLKRLYIIKQIRAFNENLNEKDKEEIIEILKEDKFLDTKEVRRALTITFTILYIYGLFEDFDIEKFKFLSFIYTTVIAFYFGSRAIESSKIIKSIKR